MLSFRSRDIFLAFLILSWCATSPALAAAAESRPNVILIVIDDMGWADLSCYGSKFHRSPQIDRLANEGVRFTQGYAACPVCSPTRAALLTGKWPARLHLTDWLPGRGDQPAQKLARPKIEQQLPLAEITLAEQLGKAGYATASIGKWHLGGQGFSPTDQGFALNIAGDQGGSPPGFFAPFFREGKNGKAAGRKLTGLDSPPDGACLTDLLNDAAVKFIEDHRQQPFFLYLPHYAVHIPLQAKPEQAAKMPPPTPFRGQQNSPVYAAMIETLDEGIGRILAALDRLQLAENTLIFFTSDNGGLATLEGPHTPATSNAPLREGKGFLYEGGVRVPLLARWPAQIKAGRVCDDLACSVDLFPTIAAACGVKLEHAVDGVDLAPALTGSGSAPRDTLYWHYPHYANQGGKPGAAIRQGDWKLIEFFEDGRRELFNLKTDARESRNLAPQEAQRVQALAAELARWKKSVAAQEMTANPAYAPNPPDKDGVITLPAKWAEVHGGMLRFEPLPHKNTLGYWVNKDDWARFEFDLPAPGKYTVEMLVGCGNGSGGSEVAVAVGGQELKFTVEVTGGFQEFRPREIGVFSFTASGRQSLTVKPLSKPGPAVMDLRQIRLLPMK